MAINRVPRSKNRHTEHGGILSKTKSPHLWSVYFKHPYGRKFYGSFTDENAARNAYNFHEQIIHYDNPLFLPAEPMENWMEFEHIRKRRSKYIGVTWNKNAKKWIAQLRWNGEDFRSGYYKYEIDAAKKYNEMAIEIIGPTARLNYFDDAKTYEEKAERQLKEAFHYFGYFPDQRHYDRWASAFDALSYYQIRKHTGKSLDYFRRKMKLPLKNQPDSGIIIRSLKKAAEIYGSAIRKKDYIEWYREKPNQRPSINQVASSYGTFNEAKIAAGLYPNKGFGTKIVTAEDCKRALKKAKEELGDTFTEPQYEDWRKGKGYPSANAIRQKIGAFRSSLEEIEVIPYASQIEASVFYRDVIDYVKEKLRLREYEKWARENNRQRPDNFRRNGLEFSEVLIQVLKTHINQRENNQ